MSRAKMPILICDSDDICDEWTIDEYGATITSVNGVRVTSTERSPGWATKGYADFCPEHKSEASDVLP